LYPTRAASDAEFTGADDGTLGAHALVVRGGPDLADIAEAELSVSECKTLLKRLNGEP
jgi:hypothetical protein